MIRSEFVCYLEGFWNECVLLRLGGLIGLVQTLRSLSQYDLASVSAGVFATFALTWDQRIRALSFVGAGLSLLDSFPAIKWVGGTFQSTAFVFALHDQALELYREYQEEKAAEDRLLAVHQN